MDFLFSQLINFMTMVALIIFAIIMSSIMTFALLQSAKDADEAWEKAIKNKQNSDKIES